MSDRFGVPDHSPQHAPDPLKNPTPNSQFPNIGSDEPAFVPPAYAPEPVIDAVCKNCGAATKGNQPACPQCRQPYYETPQMGPNIIGPLCYLGGWVTGLMVYLGLRQAPVTDARARFMRFHSAQSVLVFGGLTLLMIFVSAVPFLIGLTMAGGFAAWLFLMFKAYQGGCYKLPYVGDIAERL
jgi:uncharacterized membrane protein